MYHKDKWPVGSIHPVYGEVVDGFYIPADDRYCRVFGGTPPVYVAVQALNVAAELHSLFSRKIHTDVLYDVLKTLPPEALDEIEHVIYAIHQENNNNFPEN